MDMNDFAEALDTAADMLREGKSKSEITTYLEETVDLDSVRAKRVVDWLSETFAMGMDLASMPATEKARLLS